MFMLTREERHRFAEWLAFQAQTNIGLADQLDSLNVFGGGKRYRTIAAAQSLVAAVTFS
jgi:hypothetical protein